MINVNRTISIFTLMVIISSVYLPSPANAQYHNGSNKDPLDGSGFALEGTGRIIPKLTREIRQLAESGRLPRGFGRLVHDRAFNNFAGVILDDPDGLVVLRLYAPGRQGYAYVVWNRDSFPKELNVLKGPFWSLQKGVEKYHEEIDGYMVSNDVVILKPGVFRSPVIKSVSVKGKPIQPFKSHGDLWMSTLADDNNIYCSWGDGLGVSRWRGMFRKSENDCGIAQFSGNLPDIKAEEICYLAPTVEPNVNDKPSSLLFMDGRLYGHFHSPLGDPWIGYLAYSDNYGRTWQRIGFWQEWEGSYTGSSPWTADRNSKFRCQFFINMGKNYELNKDGYVYTLAIGKEWQWEGGVYLTRVLKPDVISYDRYEYFAGMSDNVPQWSESQFDAYPLAGVLCGAQGSVIYHPQLERYLFLTSKDLYDAPNPWGPWTYAGNWVNESSPEYWRGGYMPGIISKDTGPDYFWFTITGTDEENQLSYCLNLGKMIMELR